MTPKQYREIEERIVSTIRALQTDINNPFAMQSSIERDEKLILQLQENIRKAKERQAKLPQLLEEAKAKLQQHRAQKPSIANRLEELDILRREIARLQSEDN